MSHESLRQDIETLLKTNWSRTQIEFENVPFDDTKVDEYISIYIREGSSEQSSLGTSGQYKITGVVIISIFTDSGIGTKDSRAMADAVSNIFRGVKLGSILFQTPNGQPIRNTSGYFQFNVTVPFYAYFSI